MGKIVLFWENSFILNINLFLEIIDDFQGGVGCSEVKGGRLPQGGVEFSERNWNPSACYHKSICMEGRSSLFFFGRTF